MEVIGTHGFQVPRNKDVVNAAQAKLAPTVNKGHKPPATKKNNSILQSITTVRKGVCEFTEKPSKIM